MIIGNFRNAGSSYSGVVKTLTFTTEAVFEPIQKKTDRSSGYRA